MAFGGNTATDINTDLGGRAMDPDMALGGRTGSNITMASDGNSGLSHQAAPHHHRFSSSVFAHSTQTAPLQLLSHLSTTYLLTVVVPV